MRCAETLWGKELDDLDKLCFLSDQMLKNADVKIQEGTREH